MKNVTLAVTILLASISAHAMDFTGMDIQIIKIPQNPQDAALRKAVVDSEPTISMADWINLTDAERAQVMAQVAEIHAAQAQAMKQINADEAAYDQAVNPAALCAKKFGAGYQYGGRVESQSDGGRVSEAGYMCVKDGPSKRTSYEKFVINVKGYLTKIGYHLRHPLS